ncbi:MAG: GNAT family N-acetyltransferase [Deltaproteobacteria bacterium]|nr:GNAT family N-acetyltransferase [Deltaproteobacteria bacterium]
MLELREFAHSDIPAMVAIQRAITKKEVSEAWTRMIERHLDDRQAMGFVAVRDGKIVGFAIGEVKGAGFGVPESGWIVVVGVEPQAMGEGVGKAMIDKLFDSFRERNVTNVYTAVRWDAGDMLSFFKALGFGQSEFINLTRKL